MIDAKTIFQAHVLLAGLAHVVGLLAVLSPGTADNTVAFFANDHRIVLMSQ